MLSQTEDHKVNSKLSQIQHVFRKKLINNKNNTDCEWIFQGIGNLNEKIQETKYLHSHCPELIGCTALHLAVHCRELQAYKTLIRKGADFTLQNNNGATALHVVIEISSSSSFRVHEFVMPVLSAHLECNNFQNPCNKNGFSHFHIACWFNNAELVEQFLNYGVAVDHVVNMDSTLCPGYTPLHFAAKHRCFEVIKVLLAHGANTQIQDAKGMTPLHIVLQDHLEIVDPTVAEKYGSDLPYEEDESDEDESKTNSQSSLDQRQTDFLTQKLVSIIKLFLIHNNDIATADAIGLSQIHVSCTIKDSKETEHLLEKVTDVNQTINMNSLLWPGYTALHFAAHFDVDTVKLLLKKGANIEIKDAKGMTPFDICLRRYDTLDIHSIILLKPSWKKIVLSDGKTRLSDPIFGMRDADCFKKFLRRLAKNLHVHVPNNSPLWPGFSLMHIAVVIGKRGLQEVDKSKLQILEELVRRKPTLLQYQEVHGWTPLHLAYRLQKDHLVNVLLKHHQTSSDPRDIADKEGLSLVHIASTTSNAFLKDLLSKGSDVNAVYKGTSFTRLHIHLGATPLHFAVAHNSEDGMNILLDYNADFCAKDVNDMTPVHLLIAANRKGYGHGHVLLNWSKLKDSVVNSIGLSHLHVACLEGHFISTDILLKNGANIDQKLTTDPITIPGLSKLNNWKGCAPLEIACKRGAQDCVNVLIKHDPDCAARNYRLLCDFLMGHSKCYIIFSHWEIDEEMYVQLKANLGMTKLHFVCWQNSYDLEKIIVDLIGDVNCQMPNDSPVWPGWTPVHVLLSQIYRYYSNDLFDFFVKAGIDVTLASADGKTAVHMAYRYFRKNSGIHLHSVVNQLLEVQKDFSVNPTTLEGITHFHIACAMANAPIVQKFLQHGSINVNQPIDFFHKTLGGQTPLHLLASGWNYSTKISSQLETVELLIKYGADVHAENSCGNIALHECASTSKKSVDLFERIVREGADVNARNILGETPLKCFLSGMSVPIEGIKTLLRLGCRLNAFNPVTEEGCFGQAIYEKSYEEIENLVSSLQTDYSSLIEPDDRKRTIIHNIVSIVKPKITVDKYAELITLFSKIGCSIDDRDTEGKTPLHTAVQIQNIDGISALLLAGANVNLVNANGITALDECFRGCEQCEYIFETASNINYCEDFDDDDDEDDYGSCRHIEMFILLAIHVRKLLHCKIDVSFDNKSTSDKAFHRSAAVRDLPKRFFKEIEDLKNIVIEPYSIKLADFLSETGAIVDYPTMSLAKRTAINEFFLSSKIRSFRKKFKKTAGIIQFQYRKAVLRIDLLELAKDSLTALAGIRIDDLCFHIIFKYLKNSEILCLIASAAN